MNGYICFYNGKRVEVHADSLYAAKKLAIASFQVPKKKESMVSVVLAEVNSQQVTHVADF
jgi:hypothetical protein